MNAYSAHMRPSEISSNHLEVAGNVEFCWDPPSRKRRRNNDGQMARPPLVGYIFRNEQSGSKSLLIAPQQIMKDICLAAHTGCRVRINGFSQLPLSGNAEIPTVLKLLSTGFCAVDKDLEAVGCKRVDEIWELHEIMRREAVDRLTRTKSDNAYTFHATVSAISPILTHDPSDPCSIMELYEASSGCSCVAVLQKPALIFHAAIVPGEDVIFRNVKRFAWSTRLVLAAKGYERLAHRIPSYVFVVENADQIEWSQDKADVASDDHIEEINTVSGTIQSVGIMVSESGMKNIQYLAIMRPDGYRCNLFLSQYPLPSDMQQALQPGATIKSYNTHQLSDTDYCACTRSTVKVIETSHSNHGRLERQPHDLTNLQPCVFLPTAANYLEWACRRQIDDFLKPLIRDYDLRDISSKDLVCELVPHDYQKSGPRIAIAEFFDHSVDLQASTTGNDLNVEEEKHGCEFTRFEQKDYIPYILSLKELRSKVSAHALCSIDFFLSNQKTPDFQVGWTGSTLLEGCELGNSKTELYTGGLLTMKASYGGLPPLARLADKETSIPISFPSTEVPFYRNSFAFSRIQNIHISFVYLGESMDANMKDNESSGNSVIELPTYRKSDSLAGSCTLVCHRRHLFLLSMSLDGDHVRCFPLSGKNDKLKMIQAYRTVSIGACLNPHFGQVEGALVEGVLVRKFFKLMKPSSNLYKGMMLVVSHISRKGGSARDLIVDASAIQTLDVKPSVEDNNLNKAILRRESLLVMETNLTEEQLTLAGAWWSLADNEHTCNLLGGGMDELVNDGPRRVEARCVVVRFPQSRLQIDERWGFVRFRGTIQDLFAFPLRNDLSSDVSEVFQDCYPAARWHFLGGRRFFPGMLSLRPRRKMCDAEATGYKAYGELLEVPDEDFAPICTLSDIHRECFGDFRRPKLTSLAPSLVRSIRQATILGIVYCRAVAECTKCFSKLKSASRGNQQNVLGDNLSSSERVRACPPNFREKPDSVAQSAPLSVDCHTRKSQQDPIILRCPSQCHEKFASIKWECSCVLDDGTGQAKLHAERDVALALLGMRRDMVEEIEKGAFFQENGIVFSRGMPPKPYLSVAVGAARSLALDELAGCSNRRCRDEDVLKYLTPLARAEYLMQRHCRQSLEPFRELIYYVRCKPVSDEIRLNQTCIETHVPGIKEHDVHRRDEATYSLPVVKLNLVDCSVKDTTIFEDYNCLICN